MALLNDRTDECVVRLSGRSVALQGFLFSGLFSVRALANPPADVRGIALEVGVFLLGSAFLGGIMWLGTGIRVNPKGFTRPMGGLVLWGEVASAAWRKGAGSGLDVHLAGGERVQLQRGLNGDALKAAVQRFAPADNALRALLEAG